MVIGVGREVGSGDTHWAGRTSSNYDTPIVNLDVPITEVLPLLPLLKRLNPKRLSYWESCRKLKLNYELN